MKRIATSFFLVASLMLTAACGHKPLGKNMSLTTLNYAVKDGDTLRMDVLLDSAALLEGEKHPVMIFSFGGGWEGGKRQDGHAFLEDAAHHGFVAVGIDYRLGIKVIKEQGTAIDSTNFVTSYSKAVLMGVEDLLDATRYVIDHAAEWNADTSHIVISGSSAGAINSMTAEYLVCNSDSMATSRLPQGFNYAAVVPFAGGVWLADADTLVWKQKPCPVLAYHGSADQLVPYEKTILQDGAFGAFGAAYLAPQLKEMQVPYLFHAYQGADHVIAMLDRSADARAEMFAFVDRVTKRGGRVAVSVTEDFYAETPTFLNLLKCGHELNVK